MWRRTVSPSNRTATAFFRCGAARFGRFLLTHPRRRSHHEQTPSGANGPPVSLVSSSRASSVYRSGCLRFLGWLRARAGDVVHRAVRGFLGDFQTLRFATSVIFGRNRCFEGLRGGGEHHRPGRTRADRRRPAYASSRRTSPSGRTAGAPSAPALPVSAA
jgi:hypothetical protein